MRHLNLKSGLLAIASILIASCQTTHPQPDASLDTLQSIKTVSSDGVQVYGYDFGSDLTASTPLIVLFHQGGSNARGEYSEIANWLQDAGHATIGWDIRSGGELYGSYNQTQAGLVEGTASGYCETYPDLEAALMYVESLNRSGPTIVWGSSYTGALVFQLAAKNSGAIDGVMAFSPAAGGPLTECLARDWAGDVDVPMLALRTETEMESPSGQAQKESLETIGADYIVVSNGIHGSSMLLDERTGSDMSDVRADVLDWLSRLGLRKTK